MVAQKGQNTIQLGDFVAFERVCADREWRNTLAKVIDFPTSGRVHVELFERAETAPRTSAHMDERLQEIATRTGKEDLLEKNRVLDQELHQLAEEEDKALGELFRLRGITQQRRAEASAHAREMMEALDRARDAVASLPQRQWRDLRAQDYPTDAVVSLCRAIMLALREDSATSWDAVKTVMQRPDFVGRIMQLDCAVTPLPKARRRKICAELGIARRGLIDGASTKTNTRKEQKPRRSFAVRATQLEIALLHWLGAQLACCDVREMEEQIVDDCLLEHQEQVSLARQVNDICLKASTLRQRIVETRLAICEGTPLAALLLEDDSATTDSIFFRRMSNGRHVAETISRDSVLVVFGAKAEELEADGDGVYVRLTPDEIAELLTASRAANDTHDVEELEALYAADEREEQEIRELKGCMEELRLKDDFMEADDEEMRRLDAQFTNVVRRHETTQWRARILEASGRDKLFIEGRRARSGIVNSDLHLMFSGDSWWQLVENQVHRENLEDALRRDLASALGLPAENISDIRFTSGSPLVEVVIKHSSDVTSEQLQAIANEADYSEFCGYCERVVSQKVYPLNTPLQIQAYEDAMYLDRLLANFSGAGLPEKLEDFADDDDEGVSDDEEYRRPIVRIATVRCEYGLEARYGYPILARVNHPSDMGMNLEGLDQSTQEDDGWLNGVTQDSVEPAELHEAAVDGPGVFDVPDMGFCDVAAVQAVSCERRDATSV